MAPICGDNRREVRWSESNDVLDRLTQAIKQVAILHELETSVSKIYYDNQSLFI
jgi:hypothetical protein